MNKKYKSSKIVIHFPCPRSAQLRLLVNNVNNVYYLAQDFPTRRVISTLTC